MDNALCRFEMIRLSPLRARPTMRSDFSPCVRRCPPGRFPRVLYQRRLEKTHITGDDGMTLWRSPHLFPLRQKTDRRIGMLLCNLRCWKASLQPLGYTRVHFHHTTDFEGFFRPGFLAGYLHSRAVLLFVEGRDSPRIRVTCVWPRCGWTVCSVLW